MTAGNQMQVDALVALQEAEVREEFLKQRTLLLGQHLVMQKQENKALLDKINGLEADLRLAKGDSDPAITVTEHPNNG
ncbi:hypothetical protein G3A56_01830 [Rhizobium oryzihabitans]|uniref:Uncharacterized protein n=1 Tax=Rhizobium oryzihabitans TaxID=2267833 RepID=A0A7L5BDH5_9HYPH|nr:hypothetical protein [Rhizobium oryzihabitans]QIB36891.1 hypothetical protein G3A56_01830 [Rhizobium oryzihabitans]